MRCQTLRLNPRPSRGSRQTSTLFNRVTKAGCQENEEPGIDNITTEFLKADGKPMTTMLNQKFNTILE